MMLKKFGRDKTDNDLGVKGKKVKAAKKGTACSPKAKGEVPSAMKEKKVTGGKK